MDTHRTIYYQLIFGMEEDEIRYKNTDRTPRHRSTCSVGTRDQGDWDRSIPLCTSSDWLLVVDLWLSRKGSHLSKRWININTYSNQDPLGRQIYFPPDDLNIFQTRRVRNSKILLYTNVMLHESYLLRKHVACFLLAAEGGRTTVKIILKGPFLVVQRCVALLRTMFKK
jgi:hypothetical protein